jgi:hypothetical protein
MCGLPKHETNDYTTSTTGIPDLNRRKAVTIQNNLFGPRYRSSTLKRTRQYPNYRGPGLQQSRNISSLPKRH